MTNDGDLTERFEWVRQSLRRLASTLPAERVFGAQAHQFTLDPPASEDEVRSFEQEHRIVLPADYRAFLTRVGNGGAGPFYGVFRLGEMDDNLGTAPWREADIMVGVLARPFPHTAAWNDLSGYPTEPDDWDPDTDPDLFEDAQDAFDRRYWATDQVNGAIPICHEGCALRDWLVVTGPEAGHVWHDARTEFGGLEPISIGDQGRVSFLDWYFSWLNEALAASPT